MTKFKFATDQEIEKMSPEELRAYAAAENAAHPATPEDKKRWAEMAQEMIDNLNKNV